MTDDSTISTVELLKNAQINAMLKDDLSTQLTAIGRPPAPRTRVITLKENLPQKKDFYRSQKNHPENDSD